MKKVFLMMAVVATFGLVSCGNQSKSENEVLVDSTEVVIDSVAVDSIAIDSVVVDTVAE